MDIKKIIFAVLTITLTGLHQSVRSQNNRAPTFVKNLISTSESVPNIKSISKDFNTLETMMEATGFEDLLKGSAPFTIFAPSDKAFERLKGISVDDLLDENDIEELKSLLGYHIVAGKLSASKMLKALCRGEGEAKFTTIQGDIITASMKGIDIVLSDGFGNTATIVVADADQGNGVVHKIDGVIRPNVP